MFLRPLTELLLAPFDDVRQSANTVLDIYISMNSSQQMSISREGIHDQVDPVDQNAKNQAHLVDDEEHIHKFNDATLVDFSRAEKKLGITGRADHADGSGRLNNLLFTISGTIGRSDDWRQSRYLIVNRVISKLETEVDIAKDDLLLAVSSMPLHGHLIALR